MGDEGDMGKEDGVANGILLLGRLLLAACFLPAAVMRLPNISGFAATLAGRGIPYADVVATLIVLAEIFGPLALIFGLAPRLSAAVLFVSTAVSLGALHRFWEYGGPFQGAEQAIFTANLGILAGLLFYYGAGPGDWSWQAWRKRLWEKPKPAPKKKKSSRQRAPKPRPAPARSAMQEEDNDFPAAA